jgi:hypothetical protein
VYGHAVPTGGAVVVAVTVLDVARRVVAVRVVTLGVMALVIVALVIALVIVALGIVAVPVVALRPLVSSWVLVVVLGVGARLGVRRLAADVALGFRGLGG